MLSLGRKDLILFVKYIYTPSPRIMLFSDNTDEMPLELNSYLLQLPMVKLVSLYTVSLKVTEPSDNVK